jgi:predicted nucleic-acid-binding Zn-ribbon protein
MANTKYLRCSKCGCDAVPTKAVITNGKLEKLAEVGTSTLMRCHDCASPDDQSSKQYATMCRQCCPSNHGTYCYQDVPELAWPDSRITKDLHDFCI